MSVGYLSISASDLSQQHCLTMVFTRISARRQVAIFKQSTVLSNSESFRSCITDCIPVLLLDDFNLIITDY